MPQNHLFIMDPFERLNLKLDSSLRMAFALRSLGHKIFFASARDLSWQNTAKYAQVIAYELCFNDGPMSASLGTSSSVGLDLFNGIHMRKDPPFDLNYIANTWVLDAVPATTKVLNNPQMLRSFNEKLGTFQFAHWMLPSCVSANVRELLEFARKLTSEFVIIKPLDLYGGRGIEKMPRSNFATLHAKLEAMTSDNTTTVMIQPFDPAVFSGEIRAFTAGGEIIAWCKKVPAKDNFLANTGAGATLVGHFPTSQQKAAVEEISKKLLASGVFLTGIDLIGDQVSEINITSPRMLIANGDEKVSYEKIARLTEAYCN
jgi:glutathione synthase